MSISNYPRKQVLTDAFFPAALAGSITFLKDISLILTFSLIIALSAQIAIPLPFTIVPLTLQTFSVLLAGAALGSRKGSIALLLYLSYGALGAPVFAAGGGGIIKLTGFTAGYLWAFPVAAFVTGWLCEKGFDRSFKTSIISMIPGSLIIYLFGVLWLAFLTQQNITTAINQGMTPFIMGDIIKILLAGTLLPLTWKFIGKNNK